MDYYDVSKPIVRYVKEGAIIKTGQRAFVVTVDHPETQMVTPGDLANTSKVIAYFEESGEFETENTRYIPNE